MVLPPGWKQLGKKTKKGQSASRGYGDAPAASDVSAKSASHGAVFTSVFPVSRVARVLIIALILLASLFARTANLSKNSLTPDEAWEYSIAKQPVSEIMSNPPVHPFFTITYHFWLKLGDSEFHCRLLSAICGTATVLFAFLIGSELCGFWFGCLAAAAFGILPINIYFSRQARMYPMALMFETAGIYFFARMFSDGRRRNTAMYMLFSILGLLTHLFTIFVMVGEGMYVVTGRLLRLRTNLNVGRWALSQAGIALVLMPFWIKLLREYAGGFGQEVFLNPKASAGTLQIYNALMEMLFIDLGVYLDLNTSVAASLAVTLAIIILPVLCIWGILLREQRKGAPAPGLFFAFLSAVPALLILGCSAVWKPIFYPRYIYFLTAGFTLLLCAGVIAMRRPVLVAVAILLFAYSFAATDVSFYKVISVHNWREIMAEVRKGYSAGDKMLFLPDGSQYAARYYARDWKDGTDGLKVMQFLPEQSKPGMTEKVSKTLGELLPMTGRVWFIYYPTSDPGDILLSSLSRKGRQVYSKDYWIISVRLFELGG